MKNEGKKNRAVQSTCPNLSAITIMTMVSIYDNPFQEIEEEKNG